MVGRILPAGARRGRQPSPPAGGRGSRAGLPDFRERGRARPRGAGFGIFFEPDRRTAVATASRARVLSQGHQRSLTGCQRSIMDRTQTPRALIVEDHGTTREVLRRLLRVCGYEADAVGSIAEAQQRLDGINRLFLDLELT